MYSGSGSPTHCMAIQSTQCLAAPAALHRWDPSRSRRKLIYDDLTMASRRKLLGFGTTSRKSTLPKFAASMKYPCAALMVEKETDPRKERKVSGVEKSNDGRFKIGTNDGNVQSAKLSRKAGRGALNFLELLPELIDVGGPPRWFCPVQKTKQTLSNAPILLFLPGIVGTGAGLFFQQESLERLFELRCLHMPMKDRTPFEGLVRIVEDTVQKEARSFPRRPIYLVGDDLGGALALAVAARNPQLDLLLVLLNPATSFHTTTLQQWLPVLRALPEQLFNAAPLFLGLLTGDLNQLSRKASSLPRFGSVQQVSEVLLNVVPAMLEIINSWSKDAVLWKLHLLHSSAQYANSRLRGVKAEVLILASNRDQLLPSLQEARRLSKILPNCTFRQFSQSSHSLLLEEDFDLASTIKKTGLYRQERLKDVVSNFVPPTEDEISKLYDSTKQLRRFCSPVFFSTGDNGKVVQGLSMIPTKGPLIFIGNHTFLGLDMKVIASELLKARQVLLRGLAHPVLFDKWLLEEHPSMVDGDLGRLFGAVPVSGKNMFKLLARGENVVLYPGGAREALHRKGEEHKLFWPEQAEFIRMAAKFGATIIPLSTVGVDEIVKILADVNELTSIPVLGDRIMDTFKELPALRTDMEGEISKQALHMPLIAPNPSGPGRLYILFGQPIHTEGKTDHFRDPKNVHAAYQQVKREVEAGTSYLLNKRQADPYRNFLPRMIYEVSLPGGTQAPTFKP